MPRYLNPASLPLPPSRYAQGVLLGPAAKRLITSGQIGMRQDGSMAQGLEAQLEQAFDNIFGLVQSAEMVIDDLVKITIYCAVPGSIGKIREIRTKKLGACLVATTYIEVSGLATPDCLVEVEAEAVRDLLI